MLFTSYEFFGFVVVLFLAYYLLPKQCQWPLLLAASYLFYAAAGPQFLPYLLATTAATYLAGRGIGREMVRFALSHARETGMRAVRLDTYEGNAPATAFYPKLGYRLAGSTEFFFEGFIQETLICFEKDLRSLS